MLTLLLVGTVIGLGAVMLLDDDGQAPEGYPTDRVDQLLAQWFALVQGAVQADRDGDRAGFLEHVELLNEILHDICALPDSVRVIGSSRTDGYATIIFCDAQGERVSQSEAAVMYQTALMAPEQLSLEQLLQTATQLLSLGFAYEARIMLDLAKRDV